MGYVHDTLFAAVNDNAHFTLEVAENTRGNSRYHISLRGTRDGGLVYDMAGVARLTATVSLVCATAVFCCLPTVCDSHLTPSVEQ